MPRTARVAPGVWVYHVLNRAVARLPVFRKKADYAVFERVMLEAYQRHPTRGLAWYLMRHHGHFVIRPRGRGVDRVHALAVAHAGRALACGAPRSRLSEPKVFRSTYRTVRPATVTTARPAHALWARSNARG